MSRTLPLIHYHAPNSRSAAIRWLFEELGVPHDMVVLDLKKGEHKTPEYLAINPMGKVPAIKHGDTVVTETAAINLYLADLFPGAGLAPKVDDPKRGTYLRWIVFNQAAVEPAVTDKALKREPGPASTLAYGTYDDTIEAMAGALAKGPYVLGEQFSAADIVIGSTVRWMLMFKLIPERSEFTSYAARLAARPALQRAIAEDQELAAAQAS